MRVSADDVEEVEREAKSKGGVTVKAALTAEAQRTQRSTIAEVHVRGMRVEEALAKVDKFLDEAVLAGHAEVRVVHGIGKGTLKKALTEFLASHPHVESTRPAEPQHGGAGAMVVVLRSSA